MKDNNTIRGFKMVVGGFKSPLNLSDKPNTEYVKSTVGFSSLMDNVGTVARGIARRSVLHKEEKIGISEKVQSVTSFSLAQKFGTMLMKKGNKHPFVRDVVSVGLKIPKIVEDAVNHVGLAKDAESRLYSYKDLNKHFVMAVLKARWYATGKSDICNEIGDKLVYKLTKKGIVIDPSYTLDLDEAKKTVINAFDVKTQSGGLVNVTPPGIYECKTVKGMRDILREMDDDYLAVIKTTRNRMVSLCTGKYMVDEKAVDEYLEDNGFKDDWEYEDLLNTLEVIETELGEMDFMEDLFKMTRFIPSSAGTLLGYSKIENNYLHTLCATDDNGLGACMLLELDTKFEDVFEPGMFPNKYKVTGRKGELLSEVKNNYKLRLLN